MRCGLLFHVFLMEKKIKYVMSVLPPTELHSWGINV